MEVQTSSLTWKAASPSAGQTTQLPSTLAMYRLISLTRPQQVLAGASILMLAAGNITVCLLASWDVMVGQQHQRHLTQQYQPRQRQQQQVHHQVSVNAIVVGRYRENFF